MNYGMQEVRPQVTLKKLVLTEAKEYKDMWLRPYDVSVGYDELNKFQEIVDRSLHMNTRDGIDGLLNNNMPNVVTPSGIVMNKAPIVNGWNTRRFKFVLIVEFKYPGTISSEIDYIQGYTDYVGATPSGNIDPNMVFYPNSVTVLDNTFDPNTGVAHIIPKYSYNIIKDETHMIEDNFQSYKLARPADVAANIGSFMDVDGVEYHSSAASINELEVVDKRQAMPTDHLAAVLKTVVDSKITSGIYSDPENALDLAIGNLLTRGVFTISFFKHLLMYKCIEDSSFTTSLLYSMFPEAEHIGEVYLSSGVPEVSVDIPAELTTLDTAETYNSDFETRISLVIHEAVSSILSESLLSEIVFEADNLTGVGAGNVLKVESFLQGINKPVYANKFLTMFLNKAWNTITNNNANIVSVLVHGSLMSDMTISIVADGRPKVIFRYPTFANSKFLPVIMDNARLGALSEGYKEIVDTALNTTQNTLVKSTGGVNPTGIIY